MYDINLKKHSTFFSIDTNSQIQLKSTKQISGVNNSKNRKYRAFIFFLLNSVATARRQLCSRDLLFFFQIIQSSLPQQLDKVRSFVIISTHHSYLGLLSGNMLNDYTAKVFHHLHTNHEKSCNNLHFKSWVLMYVEDKMTVH